MAFKVVHISGPPESGKTTFARCMSARLADREHHCLRVQLDAAAVIPELRFHLPGAGLTTHSECRISADRVYERIPLELGRIVDGRRRGVIFVETDTAPCFRNAYPYDVRLFVMRPVSDAGEIFRGAAGAAEAFQRAMADTCGFAAEMFGVYGLEDSTLHGERPALRPAPAPPGGASTATLGEFLDSPMGAEVSARVQLQPAYQAILESDAIVVNQTVGSLQIAQPWVARLEALLARIGACSGRRPWFSFCNPADPEDPLGRRALAQVEQLIRSR